MCRVRKPFTRHDSGLRMLRQDNFELEASLGYVPKEYQTSLVLWYWFGTL